TGIANSGSHPWTVPATATATARVRATAHDAAANTAASSSPADFAIADQASPVVTVTSPSGGEDWAMGSGHNITWTATDNVAVTDVDLAYSTDGGATYPNTIATGIANSGSYAWTVPGVPTAAARVRVTAHDGASNATSAASAANFTISDQAPPSASLTAPAGGETWAVGSGQNITWTATDNVGVTSVDLAYSTDGGATYAHPIGTGIANSGSYAWTVPATPSTTARVRVTAHDAASNSASASSAADFAIADQSAPAVAVASPVGGEAWYEGSAHNINWTATDDVGVASVSLDYSRHGAGGPWIPVASGLANTGSYPWTLPGPATDSAFVRVRALDAASNTGTAQSDSAFHILPPLDTMAPVVVVTSPVGGESWVGGSTHNVTWTATDNVGVDSVNVDYSLTGTGGAWITLAHSLANSGSYPWLLPAVLSDSAVVRVTAFDHAVNAAADLGDSLFHITASAVGVGGPRPTVFTLYRPSPNPARGSVELRFHIVRSGDATAEIFSVGGSRVWHSFMPGVGAGEHRVAWDGRGSSGERVTSGLYFVRVSCAEGVRTARMVRLP
ncbi:MAG: T9SS type A sorting domain-containing protein, partial [Candidatus Eisenbacteria bacterium]|nr:T9SS type A sorting domain-containing protein [Candidatus Eisenbacteria bacterium]